MKGHTMGKSGKGKKQKREPSPLSPLIALERAMGGAAKTSDSKIQEAQNLVYDAWEADSAEETVALIMQALELDPRNVDALLMVADAWRGEDEAERERLLRQVVSIAAVNLGEKTFTEDRGYFWGLLETRPYMRARAQLAELLLQADRFEEAIPEHEEMLELCTNDNLGIRYGLLACYLATNRLEDARRLIERCDEEKDFSAMIAWACVLERYLAGDLDGALKELNAARAQNGFVEAYLKGHRKLPASEPSAYSPGSREEAICCASVTGRAWEQHPLALKWLKDQDSK